MATKTKQFLNNSIKLCKWQQEVARSLYYYTNDYLSLEEFQDLEHSLIKTSSLFSKILAEIYKHEQDFTKTKLPMLPNLEMKSLNDLFRADKNDDKMTNLLKKLKGSIVDEDDGVTYP